MQQRPLRSESGLLPHAALLILYPLVMLQDRHLDVGGVSPH
jgi:hypothetical protein